MDTQSLTLTQYILRLLEKEENREKFNSYDSGFHPVVTYADSWSGLDKTRVRFLEIQTANNFGNDFCDLTSMFKREIIRIALLSLKEFKQRTHDYKIIIVEYEMLSENGKGQQSGRAIEEIASYLKDISIREGKRQEMPKTLAEKYGQMLYNHTIEELDEEFMKENITM